jgi:hypothetical protein
MRTRKWLEGKPKSLLINVIKEANKSLIDRGNLENLFLARYFEKQIV